MQGRGELQSLQAGRALAAVAVVLFHLNSGIFGSAKYWPQEASPALRPGIAGVEYFFVLSGFIMAYVHWGQMGRANDPRQFLWKRFLRIYPPYWVALALAVPFTGATNLLTATTLAPVPAELPLTVAWTLQHEVLFYAMFALFLWRPKVGAPLAALWLIPSLIVPFVDAGPMVSLLFSAHHLLFFMGAAGAVAMRSRRINRPAAVAAAGAIGFAATWATVALTDGWGTGAIWAFGGFAMLLVAGLAQMEIEGRYSSPPGLTLLGDASYSIYLVHFPLLSVGAKALFATGLAQRLPPSISFAALLIGAVAGGVAFHLGVEKPLLSLFRRRAPVPTPAAG